MNEIIFSVDVEGHKAILLEFSETSIVDFRFCGDHRELLSKKLRNNEQNVNYFKMLSMCRFLIHFSN